MQLPSSDNLFVFIGTILLGLAMILRFSCYGFFISLNLVTWSRVISEETARCSRQLFNSIAVLVWFRMSSNSLTLYVSLVFKPIGVRVLKSMSYLGVGRFVSVCKKHNYFFLFCISLAGIRSIMLSFCLLKFIADRPFISSGLKGVCSPPEMRMCGVFGPCSILLLIFYVIFS